MSVLAINNSHRNLKQLKQLKLTWQSRSTTAKSTQGQISLWTYEANSNKYKVGYLYRSKKLNISWYFYVDVWVFLSQDNWW